MKIFGHIMNKILRRISVVFCIITGASFGQVVNAAEILSVDFGQFAKGFDCIVSGATGEVDKVRKDDVVRFVIAGDTKDVTFHCALADGRRFIIYPDALTGPHIDEVGLQLNADNKGAVIWDDGTDIVVTPISGFLDYV